MSFHAPKFKERSKSCLKSEICTVHRSTFSMSFEFVTQRCNSSLYGFGFVAQTQICKIWVCGTIISIHHSSVARPHRKYLAINLYCSDRHCINVCEIHTGPCRDTNQHKILKLGSLTPRWRVRRWSVRSGVDVMVNLQWKGACHGWPNSRTTIIGIAESEQTRQQWTCKTQIYVSKKPFATNVQKHTIAVELRVELKRVLLRAGTVLHVFPNSVFKHEKQFFCRMSFGQNMVSLRLSDKLFFFTSVWNIAFCLKLLHVMLFAANLIYVQEELTFEEAEDNCQSLGGHLAAPYSRNLANDIINTPGFRGTFFFQDFRHESTFC